MQRPAHLDERQVDKARPHDVTSWSRASGDAEEQLLQRDGVGPQFTHVQPGVGQQLRHVGRLACGAAPRADRPPAVLDDEAGPPQYVGDADAGRPARRSATGRAASASTSSTRPTEHEPPTVDDRHPVAGLLDLAEQVARHEHGPPLGAERRSSSRISRMPAGSRPLTGSSSTSSAGSFSNAAARPSRWRMPSEYLRDLVVAALGQPDGARAAVDPPATDAVDRAEQSRGSRGRSSSGTSPASRRSRRPGASTSASPPGTAARARPVRPAGGRDQAEQAADRRRLARPVRPEETEHAAFGHGEVEPVRPRRSVPSAHRRYSLRSPSISITAVMHRQTNLRPPR